MKPPLMENLKKQLVKGSANEEKKTTLWFNVVKKLLVNFIFDK